MVLVCRLTNIDLHHSVKCSSQMQQSSTTVNCRGLLSSGLPWTTSLTPGSSSRGNGMFRKTSRKSKSLIFLSILVSLSFIAGCANRHSEGRSSTPIGGSNCYAKAMPTLGEGSLAWGASLQKVRTSSITNCRRYAGRSGGTPNTCKVVLAQCKN